MTKPSDRIPYPPQLSHNLYMFRRYRNMYQRDLADKIGVSRSNMRDIEQGTVCTIAYDKLEAIAAALHISVKTLLSEQFN